LFTVLFSCKKKDSYILAPASYDYVPTLTGHWVIYDVDSISHLDNDGNTDDSIHYFHFQIKEFISSTFIDGEGRPAQRIERSHRDNDSAAWYITNVWTSTVTSNRVERDEENIRYIILAFPITSDITWNGNAFNQLGEEDYTYEYFNQPFTFDSLGLSFDSTLSVLQIDNDNFVERIYGEEQYAVHVGRISKTYQNLLKYGGQVVSGLDYHETVNSYGNN
jgi:hypothetical protein